MQQQIVIVKASLNKRGFFIPFICVVPFSPDQLVFIPQTQNRMTNEL